MPSRAYGGLLGNKADLDRIWELHAQEAGLGPGRKYNVEVLNKAAVVLVCAAWEAYCEDAASEAAAFLIANIPSPDLLPQPLKKLIATSIREDKNELAPWRLAADRWKAEVASSAAQAASQLTGNWNTPKAKPVRELFEKAVGISDITATWSWHKNPTARVTSTLDQFVSLRGDIAHRAKAAEAVKKSHGLKFYEHIERLAFRTDAALKTHLEQVTGDSPW